MSSVLPGLISNYSLVRPSLMFHDVITHNLGSWPGFCLLHQEHRDDNKDGDDLDVAHGYEISKGSLEEDSKMCELVECQMKTDLCFGGGLQIQVAGVASGQA